MTFSEKCLTHLHYYSGEILPFVKAALILLVGYFIAHSISKASKKISPKYATPQHIMVIQKGLFFLILVLFLIAAMQQLGFQLSVLLGSAGILTAAIAFASQTSTSNMFSGLFLILEKSFQVGDTIKIGNTTGTVLSIDLLSVKILTPNNNLVRIPNETLIKSEITNLSHYDTKRLDLRVKVSSEENLDEVKSLLITITKDNKLALPFPTPLVTIQEVDSFTATFQVSVWTEQGRAEEISDSLYMQFLQAFHDHEIEI